MSSDKRLILCILLSALCFFGLQSVMIQTGLIKAPERKAAPQAAERVEPLAENQPDGMVDGLPTDPFMPEEDSAIAEGSALPEPPAAPKPRFTEFVSIGASDVEDAQNPYHLRLELDPRDASVYRATSSRFNAEFDPLGPRNQTPPRIALIQPNEKAPDAPGSLAIFVSPADKRARGNANGEINDIATKVEAVISDWEVVVPDGATSPVQAVSQLNPTSKIRLNGQEVHFRAKLNRPAVTVTKVVRIWEGQEGFEVDLRFAGGSTTDKLTYRLVGPHGIPIEGEWYTSTYRDIFFGLAKGTATEIIPRTAADAFKYADDPAQRITADPLVYAGVENQYFATFVEPWPIPRTQSDRWDASADSYVIKASAEDSQKADVTVAIVSKPITVGPNLSEVVHTYRVFAGPKTNAFLDPYAADELSAYHKSQWISIPFASTLAKGVITPLLDKIYSVTASVSRFFGGTKGNYGIAIILLTMTVRLIMFPIGRKQAMMAKKMQDLQPVLAEVKNKFKDDKEAIARETMAVYKRNKVNPAAGCVPALIQMPIFVGLWQCLNNSYELRQTSFLWIRDLAAPDMLFRFPADLPIVGRFFNILPFLVVGLMLVQTKLFSPPPTTPEAEAQQKMMKYMMVFMAFMFYKVPSGLGLYFITSSSWQICERLLLPKFVKAPATTTIVEPPSGGKGSSGGSGPNGKGSGPGGRGGPAAPPAQGWLGKRLEKLLEEAEKQKTIRNNNGDRARNGASNGDGRPRSKPPGKRL